jgi:hypothetical protein
VVLAGAKSRKEYFTYPSLSPNPFSNKPGNECSMLEILLLVVAVLHATLF